MNKLRRKKLQEIREQIDILKCELEEVRDEEQDSFDNLPESLQYSERGETMEANVSNLDEAISNLEYALDNIDYIE